MTDVPPPNPVPPPVLAAAPSEVDARTFTIIIYGLYIGGVLTSGATGIVGVIMAYIKRAEYKGTIWESHVENAIHAFWVCFLLSIVSIPLMLLFGLGFIVLAGAVIYFLYRSIKGLIAAIDSKPYV